MKVSPRVSRAIETARLPLILAVVLVHASTLPTNTGGGVGAADPGSASVVVEHFFSNVVARSAVPLLTVISALLFFRDGRPRGEALRRKLRLRVRSLLVPYLVWNTLSLALQIVGQLLPFTASFFSHRIVDARHSSWRAVADAYLGFDAGPVDVPLWFLRDLIVLVAAAPLLGFLVERAGWPLLVALFLAWNGFFAGIDLVPIVSERQIFFFCLGIWLATHETPRLERALTSRRAVGFAAIGFLALAVVQTFLGGEGAPWQALQSVTILVGTFVFAGTALLAAASDRPRRWSATLAPAAFFIFLAHGDLMMIVRKAMWSLARPQGDAAVLLYYFLAPIAVAGLLLGCYAAVRSTRWRRWFDFAVGERHPVSTGAGRDRRAGAVAGDTIVPFSSLPAPREEAGPADVAVVAVRSGADREATPGTRRIRPHSSVPDV